MLRAQVFAFKPIEEGLEHGEDVVGAGRGGDKITMDFFDVGFADAGDVTAAEDGEDVDGDDALVFGDGPWLVMAGSAGNIHVEGVFKGEAGWRYGSGWLDRHNAFAGVMQQVAGMVAGGFYRPR